MEEFLAFLPKQIGTPILIAIALAIWKIWSFVKKRLDDRKAAKKSFELEILEKERIRSKFEARITKVEQELVELKDDFKESKFEIKADFMKLENKIDRILEFLIPPINK